MVLKIVTVTDHLQKDALRAGNTFLFYDELSGGLIQSIQAQCIACDLRTCHYIGTIFKTEYLDLQKSLQ